MLAKGKKMNNMSRPCWKNAPRLLAACLAVGLALPAHADGPSLMLVAYKDGRDVTIGHGHGAVGIQTSDIAAAHERALAAGAQKGTGIITVGDGIEVAVLYSPQGHEIELVQLPG